jgi:hypothetical protein
MIGFATVLIAGCAAVLSAGCATEKYKKGEQLAHAPIQCDIAEADIRVLLSEKAHVQEQGAAGVESILPAAVVVGLIVGQEGENLKVGSGAYNRMIDKRIAQIKKQCGLD